MDTQLQIEAPRRLPLNRVDPAELRELHLAYQTYTQTRKPRRPRLQDKPVEQMTLNDLTRTQYAEPASESQRCWLATGQGALSLDAPVTEEGETIGMLATEQSDASRYGVSYAVIDPELLARIEWEQQAAQTGNVVTVRREGERVQLRPFVDPFTFGKLRARARHYGIGSGPSQPARLTGRALTEARRRAWQALRAAEANAKRLADPEWHGGYERTAHGTVVARVRYGARPPSGDTYWHGLGRDRSEVELGTHLSADEELEASLGRKALRA